MGECLISVNYCRVYEILRLFFKNTSKNVFEWKIIQWKISHLLMWGYLNSQKKTGFILLSLYTDKYFKFNDLKVDIGTDKIVITKHLNIKKK